MNECKMQFNVNDILFVSSFEMTTISNVIVKCATTKGYPSRDIHPFTLKKSIYRRRRRRNGRNTYIIPI